MPSSWRSPGLDGGECKAGMLWRSFPAAVPLAAALHQRHRAPKGAGLVQRHTCAMALACCTVCHCRRVARSACRDPVWCWAVAIPWGCFVPGHRLRPLDVGRHFLAHVTSCCLEFARADAF